MKIAVLMTVHNRCSITLKCLKCLYDNDSKKGLDIFLTDDGSTDGTSESVHKSYPDVHLIQGDGNLFWNRGMIKAWKEAIQINPDFYLWLNDDTMLFPTAICEILKTYNCVENMSIISGIVVSSDLKRVSYGGWINNKLVDMIGHVQQVQAINGNFVLIPQIVYNRIGMLDPFFHHSFGDWEYGNRAIKNGIKLYVTAKAIGICDRHDNLRKCFNSHVNIISRFRYLYSPLGLNPIQHFYYDIKCNNIIVAIKNFIALHLKSIFPYFQKSDYTAQH